MSMQREYRVMGRMLQLHLGDITRLEVDAVVSSENSDLLMDQPDGRSVSAAIRRVEGEEMAQELARLGPLEPGRAVVLPARKLPCRWVIHAASVIRTEEGHFSSKEIIRESVRSALRLAAGLGLRSIAFPAFGVRAAEVPAAEASQAMVSELVEALRERTSLRRVVVALLDPESFLAFYEQAALRATRANAPLQLRVARPVEGRLTWSFLEDGPLERLETVDVPVPRLVAIRGAMGRLSDHSGRQLLDLAEQLQEVGREVRTLFPEAIFQRLTADPSRALVMHLDESLAGLPFELAWDGGRHLVEGMHVARRLRADWPASPGSTTPSDGTRLRALLVGGPAPALPASGREAGALADLLWRRGGGRTRVTLLAGERATPEAVMAELGRVELAHWCGHTENGETPGWALAGGTLTPDEIARQHGGWRLVLANSCGADGGLVFCRALLQAGAQNVIATWWDVDDHLSERFALAFYEELVLGRTLAEAMIRARGVLREEDPLQWAAYLHYGDPLTRLLQAGGRS